MKLSFVKLFLIILLSISNLSLANELDLEASGFIFNTTFSDNNWYDNRTTAALNLDLTTDGYAARGQLSLTNKHDINVRRFTLEKDCLITNNSESVIKIGRFPRLNSFYDSVTDTPAASEMALLPQAGYNYRMYTGAFVLMNGVQLTHTHNFKHSLLYTVASAGRMEVPVQSDLILELFKQPVKDIFINPEIAFDLAIHYEIGDFHTYLSSSEYKASVHPTRITPTSKFVSTNYANADYVINKFGIQYDTSTYIAQFEFLEGVTHTTKANNFVTTDTTANDYNIILGRHIKDKFTLYSSYSHGYNKTANKIAIDRVIGTTYINTPFTVSVEYHTGNSAGAWSKYNSNITKWDLIVVSTTYQF